MKKNEKPFSLAVDGSQEKKPAAYISVGNNRQTLHGEGNNTIYLSDKEEFEIELFNPTQEKFVAYVSLNGQRLSDSGVVLSPGQRIYLDRFINEPKKFRFDTYEVDGDDDVVRQAIAKNGLVTVEFHKGLMARNTPRTITRTLPFIEPIITPHYPYPWQNSPFYVGDQVPYNIYTVSANTAGVVDGSSVTCNYANTMETGRVEQGGDSEQHFNTFSMVVDPTPFEAYTYKLLPLLQKPLEKHPEAYITVGKNRQKCYGMYKDTVYLCDGQNFEIELFNPRTVVMWAHVSLKGQSLADSGFMLKPGERLYLDRYFSGDSMFIFKNYKVGEGNERTTSVQENGGVAIMFFEPIDSEGEHRRLLTSQSIRLLPLSEKAISSDDLRKGKMHCYKCGKKVEKKFKFCPSCGAEVGKATAKLLTSSSKRTYLA